MQIIRNELIFDPTNKGYMQLCICKDPHALEKVHGELTSPRSSTVQRFMPIIDLMTFIGSISHEIENLHIVAKAIKSVTGEGQEKLTELLNTETSNIIELLDQVGGFGFLYHFGITTFKPNETVLFEEVLRNLLEYMDSKGNDVRLNTVVLRNTKKSRISLLFEDIEGAPNTITREELCEIMDQLKKERNING